jgi:hypothetical protein
MLSGLGIAKQQTQTLMEKQSSACTANERAAAAALQKYRASRRVQQGTVGAGAGAALSIETSG